MDMIGLTRCDDADVDALAAESAAPPAVFKKSAIRIPLTVANINIPATALAPRSS